MQVTVSLQLFGKDSYVDLAIDQIGLEAPWGWNWNFTVGPS